MTGWDCGLAGLKAIWRAGDDSKSESRCWRDATMAGPEITDADGVRIPWVAAGEYSSRFREDTDADERSTSIRQ